jgi:hypothetical protein
VAFQIAEALHLPLQAVLEMPVDHLKGWIAYFTLQQERRDASRK